MGQVKNISYLDITCFVVICGEGQTRAGDIRIPSQSRLYHDDVHESNSSEIAERVIRQPLLVKIQRERMPQLLLSIAKLCAKPLKCTNLSKRMQSTAFLAGEAGQHGKDDAANNISSWFSQ